MSKIRKEEVCAMKEIKGGKGGSRYVPYGERTGNGSS